MWLNGGRGNANVNMKKSYAFPCVKLLFLLHLATAVLGWDSEDLELFDLVEEVNQNFYDLLGVTQASCGR